MVVSPAQNLLMPSGIAESQKSPEHGFHEARPVLEEGHQEGHPEVYVRVGINISSHAHMGSMSGCHGVTKAGTAPSEASTASTADPSELDEALKFALDSLDESVEQNPEMAAVYADAVLDACEDPGMNGGLRSAAKCATAVIENSIPQCEGMKAMVEQICDCTNIPKTKETEELVARLTKEKTEHLSAVQCIFGKVNDFVDLVLASYPGTSTLIASQTVGIASLRFLQTEAKKPTPDEAKLEKLRDKAEVMLGKSVLSADLQRQLQEIKSAAADLVDAVKKENAALEKLKGLRKEANEQIDAEAQRAAQEKIHDLKSKAGTAAKTAGWWSVLSFGAVVGLSVVGGVLCTAAVIATGGAAMGAIAPALVVAGHVAGWTAAGIGIGIGIGAGVKTHLDAKRQEKVEQSERDAINAARDAAQHAAAEEYKRQLSNIEFMARKYDKLAADIQKASEASKIVKAHLDFLSTNGSEMSDQMCIVDMALEIDISTLKTFENKLKALKADTEHMIACAIEAKRHFCALDVPRLS